MESSRPPARRSASASSIEVEGGPSAADRCHGAQAEWSHEMAYRSCVWIERYAAREVGGLRSWALTFLVAIVFSACAASVRAQTGACCHPNGTCLIREAGACAAGGGDYMGDSEPCVAFLCRGGCCRPDGTCSENIPKLNCEINGGSYLGHQSNCTGVSCPVLPNGACCHRNFCQEGFTPGACDGLYAGDDSTCGDCPGACCLTDDSCIQSTRDDCTLTEGASFAGNLTECPPDGCGQGACCFATTNPDGECAGPIDPFNCEFSQGRYQGNGTDCADVSCPPFGGGCCCGGLQLLRDDTGGVCVVFLHVSWRRGGLRSEQSVPRRRRLLSR